MSKQTEIAASDWLVVRERVVEKLKDGAPRTEKDTRVRMAEALILAGYVDVEYIATEIANEKTAQARRAEEAAAARARSTTTKEKTS